MNKFVYSFNEIDKTMLSAVGGKGANLGELSKIPGLRVPYGFCITTVGYKKVIETLNDVEKLIKELHSIKLAEQDKISALSSQITDMPGLYKKPSKTKAE